MDEGDEVPVGCCKHGDTLNVVMTVYPRMYALTWVDRCNRMGGEPIQYPNEKRYGQMAGLRVCEDVDF
jgi:hypothetical protein